MLPIVAPRNFLRRKKGPRKLPRENKGQPISCAAASNHTASHCCALARIRADLKDPWKLLCENKGMPISCAAASNHTASHCCALARIRADLKDPWELLRENEGRPTSCVATVCLWFCVFRMTDTNKYARACQDKWNCVFMSIWYGVVEACRASWGVVFLFCYFRRNALQAKALWGLSRGVHSVSGPQKKKKRAGCCVGLWGHLSEGGFINNMARSNSSENYTCMHMTLNIKRHTNFLIRHIIYCKSLSVI